MTKSVPILFLLALCVGSPTSWAQSRSKLVRKSDRPRLFQQTNIEAGWKQAVEQRKPMLVMFSSDNCKYCKKMLSETYGHPAIERMLSDKTQTVLAHAEDYEALVKRLGIRGYPSSVLVAPNGDVLDLIEGYVDPKEFAERVSPLLKGQIKEARAATSSRQTAER